MACVPQSGMEPWPQVLHAVLSAVTALLSNLWIERDEHGEARSNSALRRRLIYCAAVSYVTRDFFLSYPY